jgi:hypothetical protein
MIFHPAVIALLLSSALASFPVIYSGAQGIRILRNWNIASGSSLQLELERRTYLISVILNYVFAFQIVSLFLYVHTADSLCTLFIGAMCAAGTLNLNGYGYPVLGLKILNFLFAGLWLILNYTDNKAYDYPLIRKKYAFLLVCAPLIVAEAVLQARYFLGLRPDIITSCCGSLFSSTSGSVSADLAAIHPSLMTFFFWSIMAFSAFSGTLFLIKGRGAYLFSISTALTLAIALASILSFISLYIYELPNHHCPFCILKEEYRYIGYPLYLSLLGAAVTGMGTGIIAPFKRIPSLSGIVPQLQRRLTLVSLAFYFIFILIVVFSIRSSHLIL